MLAIQSNAVGQCPIVRPGVVAVQPTRVARHKATTAAVRAKAAVAAPLVPGFTLSGAFSPQALPPPPAQATCPVAQFPAVLSATARTADQVAAEVEQQLQVFPQALVQAVEPEMYAALRKLLSGVQYHARAKMLIIKPKQEDRQGPPPPKQRRLPGMLCVVSAGPEDQAAADQVKLVAEHMGCFVSTKSQLSVRDLQGIMDTLPALQAADAVVAIAGADGSLAGAVAGLIDAPVVALPTSQGNSAGALAGLSGLVTAVSSCNLGVSAVGIDQPAAAAAMAARMLRVAAARVEKLTAASAAAAAPAAPASAPAGLSAVNNVVPTMLDSLSLTPAMASK